MMEGRAIGQYRVTGVLGKGGMGVVYAAKHTLLDRPAAVKVLLPKFSSDQEIVTRFFNEARITTAIQHPGIVEVYDFGWTREDTAYIVMEYLRGETLRDRAGGVPMRWSMALALVRQIAGALDAAHARGIVHRDLKPANIFLIRDPEVPGGERIKLLDFGIAKLAGSVSGQYVTRTGEVIGTPAYMAPEQCRGVAIDWRADIYSLGCILFELCTGRPPFVCEGEGSVIAAHIYEQAPTIASRVSGVPQEVETLVQLMLAKWPAARIQSADEVIRLIDATRTVISRASRSGSQPVLVPLVPLDESDAEQNTSTSADPQPTVSERAPSRRSRRDAIGALSVTEKAAVEVLAAPAELRVPGLTAAMSPSPAGPGPLSILTTKPEGACPASAPEAKPSTADPDATLSSAGGNRPRPRRHPSARRWVLLGGIGGCLALLGVLGLVFNVLRGDGDGGTPVQASATPSDADLSLAGPTLPSLQGPMDSPQADPSTPPPADAALPALADAAPSPSVDTAPTPPADAAIPQPPAKTTKSPKSPARVAAPSPPSRGDDHGTPLCSPPGQTVRVYLWSTPPGAEIYIDGEFRGKTDMTIKLLSGCHKFKYQLAGYSAQEDEFDAHDGALVAMTFLPRSPTLSPAPAPSPSPQPSPPPTSQPSPPPASQSSPPPAIKAP
jgi:eukaryotic-like serine/threonine-protein kinase